jgi:DNA repair protein RecN (Recombination protein N)
VLRDLHVRNLAVLEDVSVEFGPGLNVLTGETGAGKSIVVDSLALLAGVRATSELIRAGEQVLSVTGAFEPAGEQWRQVLREAGLESDSNQLVVRREVNREGRNRVFVQDQPVTLALLTELAPQLIRIHGQREELGLVSARLQRHWLDRSGGENGAETLLEVEEHFHRLRDLAARLERVEGDDRLRQERIDLLRFQSGEIDTARLQAGEEDGLKAERDVQRHVEAIAAALGGSLGLLFEDESSASERLSLAARRLSDIAEWEEQSATWSRELESMSIGLQEMAHTMRHRLASLEADPERLNAIEERLAVIDRLTRKYGQTSAEVLAYRDRIGTELEELAGAVERQDELEEQLNGALEGYRQAAAELSGHRAEWGKQLEDRVHRELRDLAMARARFAVELSTRRQEASRLELDGEPVDFSARGYDQVTFKLAANPGEEMLPLASSASGGELSRVYLALQLAVVGKGDGEVPTLVFDEVDAGVGGAEAAILGSKLQRLSDGGQILAVTHLAQVASHADRHLRIRKRVSGGRTATKVDSLREPDRVEEVARMLAGKRVTSLSRSHAEELIASTSRRAP